MNRPMPFRPSVDEFEERLVPSGIRAVYDGYTLLITGTPGNDAIAVVHRLVAGAKEKTDFYQVKGVPGQFTDVSRILVRAGAGNDTVRLDSERLGGLPIKISCEVYGGDGNDTIVGSQGNDYINGNNGNDKIFGNGGNDTLLGGAGHDIISGGPGNDLLDGGSGIDTLKGDAGKDTLKNGEKGDARTQIYISNASAGPNSLNPPGGRVHGFVDTDEQDWQVPFTFSLAGTPRGQLLKAQVIMKVKPLGGLSNTDSLIVKGADGQPVEVYHAFQDLKQNEYQVVIVDIDPVQFAQVFEQIRYGSELQGLIQDDTAVEFVKLRCFFNANPDR